MLALAPESGDPRNREIVDDIKQVIAMPADAMVARASMPSEGSGPWGERVRIER